MRYLLFALCIAAGSHTTQAQDLHADGTKGVFIPPPMINNNPSNQRANPALPAELKARVPGFVPNLYLFSDWTRGMFRPIVGPPSWHWLKYNRIDQQLIERTLVGGTSVVTVVNTDKLREFSVGDSVQGLRLTYRRYLATRVSKPSMGTAFYEVHYDAGKTALLCHRFASPNRDDILRYFVKTPDNILISTALGAKPLFAVLGPAHATELVAFAYQHQLDLRKETDVVQLLAYYDKL